jgi:hypothetical protein
MAMIAEHPDCYLWQHPEQLREQLNIDGILIGSIVTIIFENSKDI